MNLLDRLRGALARRRDAARRLHAARAELDRLFAEPALLAQGRLKPHHRHRATILEVRGPAGEPIESVLFGIVRHPRPHPLAPRGDDVLELLEYRPAERSLRVVGASNLTRQRG
ncbi:MAG: hypothetical protein KBD01_09600 [Acidobacteria bacterium]|nr:hypothetical protein [Acidobacteriota bacterium]